jgi:CBS domain-containing protein
MKISDIMATNVISVTPDTSVGAIARLLVDNDIDGLPVVDASGHVVGMVTESDLIVRNANLHFPRFLQLMEARIFLESTRNFDEEVRKVLGATAGAVMSSPAVVVGPDDDIERAATLMMEKRIHALPVVGGGKLVGIVTRSDLVRLMANEEQAV